MQTDIYQAVKRARSRGVPIIAISTPDCAAATDRIESLVESGDTPKPLIRWDCVRLAEGVNQAGKRAMDQIDVEAMTLAEAVDLGDKLPEGSVMLIYNAHLFLESPHDRQAVWNIRDRWKATGKMLVLLGPNVQVPVELLHDVISLDEPLPDTDEIEKIVRSVYDSGSLKHDDEAITRSAESLRGVSAFAAEQ